ISIEVVSGPDVFLIPWFNILFVVVLVALAYLIIKTVNAFKKRRIDPVVDGIDDFMDDVGDSAEQARASAHRRASEATSGFRRWLKRWFG
ncbi:MAG: DUF1523 domain-containing protein, partial [Pseudomonadota bacterium]|nr:DUF1523 domain-containing protein [Pseudomonadota bacterium]